MKIIADFHIHSRYAMACSKSITIKGIEAASLNKGINIVGTGDFTHPEWLSEIKRDLEKGKGEGLYKVKGSNSGVLFVLSTEVSTIFEQDKKIRKIHHCILVDDIEKAEELNGKLANFGNLSSDGRPTLSMSAAELVETVMNVDKESFVFPSHVWTPWFSVFGSMSGFDSIKEAYEDKAKHIYAYESGLSSDPKMNWRISELDKYSLISNSDSHSLEKIGREANVFDIEGVSYKKIIAAIKQKDPNKFKSTIEFYPEEGKYHYDGHRNCNFSIDPSNEETAICPVCGKRLVLGVLHRVNDLADRPAGYIPKGAIPYVNLIPLIEIISYVEHKSVYSESVKRMKNIIISKFGNEFNAVMNADLNDIKETEGVNPEIASAIGNIRANSVHITPGYDGVYGKIDIIYKDNENRQESAKKPKQSGLSKFLS
ncbi:endonuclease Q family protein [Candidatus Marsarchaeota archaeon]|jgi:uncharacterized protein (TIGR00375 family)|nr:endonuclease Q family protein [Candidatus Marsarchaeota archaeon]MCL5090277.1 endonuclease Q family protein [Candidatus Marsarchaeota archaeon]